MTRHGLTVGAAALLLATASAAQAQDVGMFGNSPSRNMSADASGLPEAWDVTTGMNVLWSQPVGSQAYGGPVVAGGRVYVGTNNEGRRDPAIEGDKGVVMAFDAASGEFLWQMVHDKLPAGRVNDWPLQGVCSTAYMEDDRIYYVSNTAHVVCVDAEGFKDGRERRAVHRRDRHVGDRRRRHLVVRHDWRARRLPPQPRHGFAADRRRHALHRDQQRRR